MGGDALIEREYRANPVMATQFCAGATDDWLAAQNIAGKSANVRVFRGD